jgi:hypothetical protein
MERYGRSERLRQQRRGTPTVTIGAGARPVVLAYFEFLSSTEASV